MVKKYLLPLVFLFIFKQYGIGQNVKRTTCVTPSVLIGADYCTNPDKVILTAGSESGVTYLWSTGATTQSITVDIVGTYSVTGTSSGGCSATAQMSVGRELVTNGNFTEGNIGFTSGYAYKADSANYNKELYDDSGNNAYGVGTDGQNYHPSFWGKDHTNNQSGARNFMLVNGHGSIVVWEETVPVEPNTNYYYSAWGMNLNPSSPAQLQFEVNGVKIGTIADLNNAPKPSRSSQVNLNNWVRFYNGSASGWNSGSATTAVIRIIDLNSALSGNDFGLDDISFASLAPFLIGPGVAGTDNQELCPENPIQSITYKVGSGGPPSVTGLPPGTNYTFDGLLLTISGTPTTPGTYHYVVSTTGCTVPKTASGTINVKNPGVWTGSISTDWNTAGNWCCGIIPTINTDVEINSGLTNYPLITDSVTGYCHNISLQTSTSLLISNGGKLRTAGVISSSGIFNATDGTIEMMGSVAQTISGSTFYKKTIKNLIVSNFNSSGLSISSTAADTLKISGTLSFGTDSSKLNTGDNIDILSTATATANVGIVNAKNTITGNVIVDRYINTGITGTGHAKSWQFLSTPTNGQTIRESWMENGDSAHGYGTQMTGPQGTGGGFDLSSSAYSIKYFNVVTNNWDGVANANTILYRLNGYMVFVRGDRTVTSPFAPATSTILRSKGNLLTGTIGPVTVTPDHYQSVGNPYASRIDFIKITKDAGVDDKFYTWDPYLYGAYGYGGYQTLSSVNDWKAVPGGTLPYDSSMANPTIQSGQAFFVYSTGTASFVSQAGSLSFTENCKVAGNTAVNFTRKTDNKPTQEKSFLRVSLFTGPGPGAAIADGNAVAFSTLCSNKVDRNDALKILNGGENLGLLRGGKILAVEARQPVTESDTLFYFVSNVRNQAYQLRFAPENMQNLGLHAFLFDSYNNTHTALSLSDTTFVNVSFTNTAASRSPGRFMVVFRQMSSLPITFTSLHTTSTQQGTLAGWKTVNEDGISHYEIQYSTDGIHFKTIGAVSVNPLNNGMYNWAASLPEQGNNYYRICSIHADGNTNFSQVVNVFIAGSPSKITVAPNPVINGLLNLHFTNEPKGVYKIKIANSAGQTVYSGSFSFPGGSGTKNISAQDLPKGIYQVELTKPIDNKEIINVVY